MSCDSATSPINIIPTNTTCNEKCKLTYKFKTSGISVKNKGDHLSIIPVDNNSSIVYSGTSSPEVCGSGGGGENTYSIGEIKIYSPSFHEYNGQKAKGEFLLHLNSTTGPRNLLICIPIIENNNTTLSSPSSNLKDIISYVAPFQINEDIGLVPGSAGFDLNEFIPKNVGYYSYTSKVPFHSCSTSCTDLLVYDVVNIEAPISLPPATFNTLLSIIVESDYPVNPTTPNLQYAYNETGAIYGSGSNEIYIDCQPTGSSGEIIMDEEKDDLLDANKFNILKGMTPQTYNRIKKILNVIGLVFIILIILGGLLYGITRITGKELPTPSELKTGTNAGAAKK